MGGNSIMKLKLFAGCVLSSFLAGAGSSLAAAPPAEHGTTYTTAQLKQLAHDAHSPEQYSTLAGYYGKQQKDFLQLATEEKLEWARRSQNIVSIAAKYPRPVDSARYLYEYYSYKAEEAGQLAAKYSQMQTPESPISSK
jgi:hypothetical protein